MWPGVDIVASATHLPFRSDSFDCVISVDTIEHIPQSNRGDALVEMKRVARKKVVVHSPIEDGLVFAGRRCDIALSNWRKKRGYRKERHIEEHIMNFEPAPQELENYGFSLKGTQNADLWASYMSLRSALIWPLGVVVSQLYFLFSKRDAAQPPFWGAVATYQKRKPSGPPSTIQKTYAKNTP
jgi:hypothetical protein